MCQIYTKNIGVINLAYTYRYDNSVFKPHNNHRNETAKGK